MHTLVKSALCALALPALALTPAAAQDRGADGDGGGWNSVQERGYNKHRRIHRKKGVVRYRPYKVRRHHNNDAAIAALLGIAGGAIIAGSIANSHRAPREIYVVPDRGYSRSRNPRIITYESTLEPWTRGWYRWCDDRYRSFNPRTGTFRGYDGRDHFCVPK
ncbi:BA14K family protein [Oricola sp.]|uniref:BA14K family protein n=1 Tax=Oricola sp. TaxID=1979950 RepID=UPI003BAD8F62